MVFGDNVRARRAARALPRTPPTRQEEKKGEETEKTNDKTTHHTPHTTHHTPPLFCPNTTLSQRHIPNQQCCDSKHKKEDENKVLTTNTPPLLHTATRRRRGAGRYERSGDNAKTRGHRKENGDSTRQGDTHTPAHPPFNTATTQTTGGTPTHRRGCQ
nr:MAG TPA: hypothetical protein [Caudoviricetes sp.]